MRILVTGGAGYIGSHTCVQLLEKGYETVVVDNLSNSSIEAIRRVEKITGKKIPFYKVDLLDIDGLRQVLKNEKIDAVIHFAGLKAVGESVEKPLDYYNNNITGTINLCYLMKEFGIKKIVFSSSATVYGIPENVCITEDSPVGAYNPYGRTKQFIESLLADFCGSYDTLSVSVLRYFNPIGAHESGLIGENPSGIPNNLMPYITQVAFGKLPYLNIYGNDYNTVDGTGVRDYIHVCDLAEGHIKALEFLEGKTGIFYHNLGTGNGCSVMQVIKTFESASGIKIPYKFEGRRAGDIDEYFANVQKAEKELGFKAQYSLYDMCRDSYNWQKNNPDGYPE